MEKNHNKTPFQERPGNTLPRPSLTIDYDLYQKHLDETDMSEAQKRAFLDALWSIIVSFVDLGFDVHPLQQAAPDKCGQLEIPAEFLPAESGGLVECRDQPKSQFNNAGDRQSGLLSEGSQE